MSKRRNRVARACQSAACCSVLRLGEIKIPFSTIPSKMPFSFQSVVTGVSGCIRILSAC